MSLLLEEMVCSEPGLVHCCWSWPNNCATTTESRGKKQWTDYTNVPHSMITNLLQVEQLILILDNYARPSQSNI